MNIKLRLIILSFLQFAVWGAYLTSMGNYLGSIGLGEKIGLFYAMQGFVSILMPAVRPLDTCPEASRNMSSRCGTLHWGCGILRNASRRGRRLYHTVFFVFYKRHVLHADHRTVQFSGVFGAY